MDDAEFWGQTGIEKQLAGLEARRVELCQKIAATNGKSKQVIASELSLVNKNIKAINLTVSERREARALWLAARNLLDDEMFDRFMAEARAIRQSGTIIA